MKVRNKVVVVTGGGNGIGRELCLGLLSKGASVAAVDVDASALEETLARSGKNRDRLGTYVVNITDRAAVDALPAEVISRFGAVDGIINNAGVIQPFVRLKDLDYAAIDRVMNVNLFGTLYMIKAFLPHLLARPEAHITNVSSMGGFLPVPGQTIYGAAKASVKLLTEGLNSELQGTNVKVTVVFPGAVHTKIVQNSGVSVETKGGEGSARMLPADKAARIIIEGIENDRYRVLVGPDAMLMDALYRLDPQRAARFIYKQMAGLLPK
ncbi:SDR family NAD(P)-dependent oxidoreductase [Polyangium jinanense]|uniref:SDR family oxidoreductase n=1 Tax=Polyangium jinanense TaxID=2829994 RepID=A0A9X4AU56_9BACT|nr:SDR family oxidoreductase [Polyangium jinanense]MDC3954302.1 SDR family oxidoreductase [Polyangium jinanense]MDC3984246.1 SDR family oxidoreductase [Polyangium jinanense]